MQAQILMCGGVLFLLAAGTSAAAQSCNLPLPFQYEFQNAVSASLAPDATGRCGLTVATNVGAGPSAAAFLHYQLPLPLQTVRYGFRVDSSALTLDLSNKVAMVFAATAPAQVNGDSQLLAAWLVGGASSPMLRFTSAHGSSPYVYTTLVPLAQNVNTVRLEINVGPGTAGNVRYWLNHAYTDPPDGVIDAGGAGLDNAAWGGVIAAEVGLSSPSIPFRTANGGKNLVIDQIETSDDLVFFDDFAIGAQQ